jgi:hypothetical protein
MATCTRTRARCAINCFYFYQQPLREKNNQLRNEKHWFSAEKLPVLSGPSLPWTRRQYSTGENFFRNFWEEIPPLDCWQNADPRGALDLRKLLA